MPQAMQYGQMPPHAASMASGAESYVGAIPARETVKPSKPKSKKRKTTFQRGQYKTFAATEDGQLVQRSIKKASAQDLRDTVMAAIARQQQLEIIRCVCCVHTEEGEMIRCETCESWQHSICMGITTKQQSDNYVCELCSGRPLSHAVELYTSKARQERRLTYYKTMFHGSDLIALGSCMRAYWLSLVTCFGCKGA